MLVRLLTSVTPDSTHGPTVGGRTSHWFILEGVPSPAQMDALASSCQDHTLTLSNGHSIALDPAVKFVLEVRTYMCSECVYVHTYVME